MNNKQILFYGQPGTLEKLQQHYSFVTPISNDQALPTTTDLHDTVLTVIIEITDPDTDLALLAEYVAADALKLIPKIALTTPQYFAHARQAGATELLYKPLHPDELAIRLKSIVNTTNQDLLGAADVLSHDINSPLGIVEYSLQLVLEILEDGPDALPDIKTFVENMLTASYRLRLLIMDLLDYIRLVHSQLEITKQETDIHQIIFQSMFNTTQIGEENNIIVRYDAIDDPIDITTDARLLQRIVEAALDTAIKFCQPRTAISIKARPSTDMVTISITDGGKPVAPDISPNQLFSPSVQSTLREADYRSAVGLSLPFIDVAVRTIGGQVTLTSEDDQTTLNVHLPIL